MTGSMLPDLIVEKVYLVLPEAPYFKPQLHFTPNFSTSHVWQQAACSSTILQMCTYVYTPWANPQKKFQTLTTSDWKAAIGSNSWHDLQRIGSISVSQIPARIQVEKPQNDKLSSQKNIGHSGTSLHSPGASNWQDVKAAFCVFGRMS
jgi:hypothetical protein